MPPLRPPVNGISQPGSLDGPSPKIKPSAERQKDITCVTVFFDASKLPYRSILKKPAFWKSPEHIGLLESHKETLRHFTGLTPREKELVIESIKIDMDHETAIKGTEPEIAFVKAVEALQRLGYWTESQMLRRLTETAPWVERLEKDPKRHWPKPQDLLHAPRQPQASQHNPKSHEK